jgi:hypothetical protein
MNHRIARLRLPAPCGTICFASLPLLFILPVSSYAQSELRADKQILLEAKHGTVALRKGPDDKLYVLTRSGKPPSSLWISDYSGSSMRQILSGGSEPTDLRFPKDLAVDRDGNAVVVDADGLIKIFSTDGKMLSSFPADRPESVGVLSDGRILVSGFPKDNLMSIFDRQGKLLGGIGSPAKIDEGFFNAVQNMGTIVVDSEDNIYFVFRHMLTPMIRRFKSDGTLTAEWHLDAEDIPQQILADAKVTYQENKKSGTYGGVRVLTAAAFDEDSKTLWVASGSKVLQFDGSGRMIQSFDLVRPDGGPIQTSGGLLVDRNFIRVAGGLSGTFEFLKPH